MPPSPQAEVIITVDEIDVAKYPFTVPDFSNISP
jgi:hypothetical protein